MRIAINIGGFLLKDEEWNNMVQRLFQRMAENFPLHEFIFISGMPSKQNIVLPNISSIVLANPSNHGLGLKFWYDYKLPSFLRKEKVDVLVNPDAVSSFRGNIPQVLFIKDLSFLQATSKTKNYRFVKKRFQQSLEKAASVVVFDASTKTKILEKDILLDEKVFVTHFLPNPVLKAMDWQEKDSIKDKYSEGKEFFLYELDVENPIDALTLLKAFSLFKKRQQSNMQLLMIGGFGKSTNHITTKMATYKYRNEVKALDTLPLNEFTSLRSAAYCLLRFLDIEMDLPLLHAMQIGVPTILLHHDLIIESPIYTTLHAGAASSEAIAEQMKLIYKDENLRGRIIKEGFERVEKETVENTIMQVWAAILKANLAA